jgi:hypothetical protein
MTNINDPWRDGDEIEEILKGLPEVDPPSTLVGTVMSTIAGRVRMQPGHPPATFMKRGRTMAKKALWIMAAAAAVALIAMRLTGYPPADKGTEATIGAAQRYQAPQISSADVKTGDTELQAFLQSDLFRQLAADKAAREALKNKDFQHALSDAAVRVALAKPEVVAMIADAARNATAGVKVDVANQAAASVRADAARNAKLDAVLQSSAALRAALAAPGVADAIAHSALSVALARPEVSMALSQDAVVNAVMQASNVSLDAAAASAGAAANATKDAAANAVR